MSHNNTHVDTHTTTTKTHDPVHGTAVTHDKVYDNTHGATTVEKKVHDKGHGTTTVDSKVKTHDPVLGSVAHEKTHDKVHHDAHGNTTVDRKIETHDPVHGTNVTHEKIHEKGLGTTAVGSHTAHGEQSNIVQMAQTVKKGELPSTHQIQGEMQPAQQFLAQKEKQSLSLEQGQAYHHTRKFLEAFETLLVEKNVADKMNQLLDASKRLNENTSAANSSTAVSRESRKFALALKDLVPDLVKSKGFRLAIMDLFKVMREVFQLKHRQHKLDSEHIKNKDGPKDVVDSRHNIPEEHKRRIRENIRTLFATANKKSSTSLAFQKFLNLWDMLNTELSHQHNQKDVNDQNVEEVKLAARGIIEAFTGRSLERFIHLLRKTNDIVQNDEKLQHFLRDFRSYFRKGLEHPEVIDSDKFIFEGDELIDRGSKVADKYYKNETLNDLADEGQILVESIKNDEHLQNMKYRAGKIADAFTYTDVAGTTHVDTDLISQMRADLVPFLLDRIRDIPLPDIRVENQKKFEYLVVENLKVRIEDVMPDRIQIKSKNNMDITPLDFGTNAHSHTAIKFRMEGMRPEFHDFVFRFKRRGLIKLEDEGRANLKIAGNGINVDIEFDVDLDDLKRLRLTTARVHVMVGTVQLEVIEAGHKGLLKMLAGFIAPTMKTQLENTLRTKFEEMGAQWATIINKRILSQAPMGNIGTNIRQAVSGINESDKTDQVKDKLKEKVKERVDQPSTTSSTSHTGSALQGTELADKNLHIHIHDDKEKTKHVP